MGVGRPTGTRIACLALVAVLGPAACTSSDGPGARAPTTIAERVVAPSTPVEPDEEAVRVESAAAVPGLVVRRSYVGVHCDLGVCAFDVEIFDDGRLAHRSDVGFDARVDIAALLDLATSFDIEEYAAAVRPCSDDSGDGTVVLTVGERRVAHCESGSPSDPFVDEVMRLARGARDDWLSSARQEVPILVHRDGNCEPACIGEMFVDGTWTRTVGGTTTSGEYDPSDLLDVVTGRLHLGTVASCATNPSERVSIADWHQPSRDDDLRWATCLGRLDPDASGTSAVLDAIAAMRG